MSSATLPRTALGDARFDSAQWLRSIPLAPRNLVLAALHAYRATISHAYGDVCRYYPSCSAYAVTAVQQYGAVKGAARAAARIARCHPWASGGIDDVPPHQNFRYALTPHGFVVPSPLGKD